MIAWTSVGLVFRLFSVETLWIQDVLGRWHLERSVLTAAKCFVKLLTMGDQRVTIFLFLFPLNLEVNVYIFTVLLHIQFLVFPHLFYLDILLYFKSYFVGVFQASNLWSVFTLNIFVYIHWFHKKIHDVFLRYFKVSFISSRLFCVVFFRDLICESMFHY